MPTDVRAPMRSLRGRAGCAGCLVLQPEFLVPVAMRGRAHSRRGRRTERAEPQVGRSVRGPCGPVPVRDRRKPMQAAYLRGVHARAQLGIPPPQPLQRVGATQRCRTQGTSKRAAERPRQRPPQRSDPWPAGASARRRTSTRTVPRRPRCPAAGPPVRQAAPSPRGLQHTDRPPQRGRHAEVVAVLQGPAQPVDLDPPGEDKYRADGYSQDDAQDVHRSPFEQWAVADGILLGR